MPRLLSGNDISVHLSKQTVKDAINSNPVFDEFRRTEGKARVNTSYVQSTEVKTNRQARTNIEDSVSYAAELSFEVTKQTFGYFLDAIQGAEVSSTDTSATIASDANGFVDSTGTAFAGMAVGDYVFISGFADTTLNRNYRIATYTSNQDIITAPVPTAIEAEGASVTVTSQRTTSGSTIPYYTVQTRTVDTSKAGSIDYKSFYTFQFNNSSFEVGETGTMTGSFAMVGENLTPGTAIISGQTNNTLDSSDTLSNVHNVVRIWINGVDSNCTVKSTSFEFSNNLQSDRAAGCDGEEFANGDITLSGSLAARLPIDVPLVWRDRYNDKTSVAIAIEMDHGGGDYTIIEIPQTIITEHEMPDGTNVVSNSEMTYTAEEDSRGFTAVIYRNWS